MLEGPQLIIYPGGMGGQKTAYAILNIQRIRDGTHYGFKAFKPRNSIRLGIDEGDYLRSRAGPSVDAIILDENNPRDMLKKITRKDHFILIDEAHMFESQGLKETVESLLDMRKIVHTAFLIKDYGDRMFSIAQYLLGRASQCDRFYFGVCSEEGCLSSGNHSQLFIDGKIALYRGNTPITGDLKSDANVVYRPRCLIHYEKPENHPDLKEGQ